MQVVRKKTVKINFLFPFQTQTGKSANKTFKVSISGTFCRVFLDCFPDALRREVASVEEGTGGHVKCFVRLSRPKTGCASEMMVPIEIYKHKEMAPFCFCQTKVKLKHLCLKLFSVIDGYT